MRKLYIERKYYVTTFSYHSPCLSPPVHSQGPGERREWWGSACRGPRLGYCRRPLPNITSQIQSGTNPLGRRMRVDCLILKLTLLTPESEAGEENYNAVSHIPQHIFHHVTC